MRHARPPGVLGRAEGLSPIPPWAERRRSAWRYVGQERPRFATIPKPGEESVWDYPRPPRLEHDSRDVFVSVGGVAIARSNRCIRVLETSTPPPIYVPMEDVCSDVLEPAASTSLCEWKGEATYWTVVTEERRIERAGWSYAEPFPEFEPIRGWISFYPALVECTLGGVRVAPQPGVFYGGWVTPEIVGPFKGEPGSESW